MTDHTTLSLDQWPRCCRTAWEQGYAAGPDPSGRYHQCPNCRAANQPNLNQTLGPPHPPQPTTGLTTSTRPTVTR